jgi:uncharacterized protein with PQ loop repeat
LWAAYGFIVSDIPVIAANCISFVPLSCILYLKLKLDVFKR